MFLAMILKEYRKDVIEIGKDDLAVSLPKRLCAYFVFIWLPIIEGIIIGLLKIM